MIPLLSIVSGLAGAFKFMRNAGDGEGSASESSIRITGSYAGGKPFAGGIETTGGSFAQRFRDQVARAADSNGDGEISRDELARQLARGEAGAAAVDLQYKAMDKNGDGRLSVDEFKQATPVPSSPLVQQVLQMIEARQRAAGAVVAGKD